MQSKLVAAKDYHEVALDIPAFVPDQAALQKELDRLRNPYVTWEPGGAVAAGDMVRCSLHLCAAALSKRRHPLCGGQRNVQSNAGSPGHRHAGRRDPHGDPAGGRGRPDRAGRAKAGRARADRRDGRREQAAGGAHGGRVPALPAGAAAGQSRRAGRLDAGPPGSSGRCWTNPRLCSARRTGSRRWSGELDRCRAIARQSGMVLEQMTPEQFAGNIPVKSYAELVAMTQDTCFDSLRCCLLGAALRPKRRLCRDRGGLRRVPAGLCRRPGIPPRRRPGLPCQKETYTFNQYAAHAEEVWRAHAERLYRDKNPLPGAE